MSKVATADQEAAVRKQIFKYSLSEASGPFKEFIAQLNTAWEAFNCVYFDRKMTPSAIFITPPQSPKALADCALHSAYGGKHQIRIRPAVIDGTYRGFNPNHKVKNRWLYITDILLHEMIHQMQHEVLNLTEAGYQSHGNEYTSIANQIGETLGLPPVYIRRRKDKTIPLASQWPLNVRPAGYYGDLLKTSQESEPKPDQEPAPETPPDFMTLALEVFRELTIDQHPEFIARSGIQLSTPVIANDDKPIVKSSLLDPTEVKRAQIGPRQLKDPRSREYAIQTLYALKLYLNSKEADEKRVKSELDVIQEYRHWEVLDYPDLETYLTTETGKGFQEIRRPA